MKKSFTITFIILLAAGGIAFSARRQIIIHYHVWQSGRLYSKALTHFDDPVQRERFRNLSIQHSDALVRIGYWRRIDIPIRPLRSVPEQTNFIHTVDLNIPPDISYYQIWGSNSSNSVIKLWYQADQLDKWMDFLKRENLLITKEDPSGSPRFIVGDQ
jgi:hypothetical protein